MIRPEVQARPRSASSRARGGAGFPAPRRGSRRPPGRARTPRRPGRRGTPRRPSRRRRRSDSSIRSIAGTVAPSWAAGRVVARGSSDGSRDEIGPSAGAATGARRLEDGVVPVELHDRVRPRPDRLRPERVVGHPVGRRCRARRCSGAIGWVARAAKPAIAGSRSKRTVRGSTAVAVTPVHDPAPGPRVGGILEDRDREDDVVGRDRLAVVPVGVGPEMERPRLAVRASSPTTGRASAAGRPVGVHRHETVEDEGDEVAIRLGPRGQRVDRGRPAEDRLAVRHLRRDAGRRDDRARGRLRQRGTGRRWRSPRWRRRGRGRR